MTAQLRLVASCFVLSFAFACASSPTAEPAGTTPLEAKDAERTAPLLEGMGDLHWQISSDSELTQKYFDQALTLAYGFNHLEAERSFREAARLDDDCAICFWGAALVLGPNINDPVPTADRELKAYETLGKAVARSQHASDKERALTEEVFATLDFVLERDPDHPGANHFYIHAVEQEQPERGVKPADNLRRVVPGAGHLVHMPSHIYIRVGRYHDGSSANELAIEADNDYVTQCRAQGIYPVAYVPHNHHFLWATTTMEGRSADALDAARHTAQHVDRSLMREPDLAMLQHFSAIPYYALVRFGKWGEILREPAPDADLLYPTAVWHYARGIAFARGGKLKEANQELRRVRTLASDPRLEEIRIWGLNPTSSLAAIAAAVLRAEIAAARKDVKTAVAQLRKAIAIEDSLIYGEPPDWFYPVRHNLGAILLEAGRARAAEEVYREDLARFPDNGWSLFGLAQSLRAQGKKQEAAEVQQRFEKAWRHADVEITASRF